MKKTMSGFGTDNWFFKPHVKELVLIKSNNVVKLPNKVSGLLELLCKNKDKFVDRNELFDELWDGNYSVGDRGLRQVVFQLRKVLSTDENENPIINIPRKGYKLRETVQKSSFLYKAQNNQKKFFAGVGVFLVAVLLLFLFNIEQSEIITVEPKPVTIEGGLEEAHGMSPDGKTLLYNKKVDGEFKIFRRMILDKKSNDELFVSMDGDLGGMVWNYTGDKIAFLRNSGVKYYSEIYIYDLTTKASTYVAQQVSDDISQSPYGIAWSPVEDKLAYTSPSKNNKLALFIYDAGIDSNEQLTAPSYMDTFPQWSPDGQVITFNSLDQNHNNNLYSIDVTTGRTTELTQANVSLYGHTWVDENHIIFSTKENNDYVGYLLNFKSKQLTPINMHGNFQFPHLSGSDIFYLRTNQELQMQAYKLHQNELTFEKLIDSIGYNVDPVFYRHSEKLVFLSDRTGKQELWYLDNSMAEPVQITFKETSVAAPSFSSSGSRVLYHWFNPEVNEFQLGVYDLESMRELPIDVTHSRNGRFAGGDNFIAFLKVSDLDRQLWVYDIEQNEKKMIRKNLAHILGASPDGYNVYFDNLNVYFSYNLMTQVTTTLEQKGLYKFPVVIQGDSIFHVKLVNEISHMVKYNFITKHEDIMFSLKPEQSKNLYNFAIGNNEKNIVLNLYSKNEGDIYKFSKTELIQ